MTYAAKTRENQIAISLGRCAASVKQAGSGHWEFALANGEPLGVSARLLEGWLLLDAPLPDRVGPGRWWDLLRLNATLQGLSKFVLRPAARSSASCPTSFRLSESSGIGAEEADCGIERQTEVCRTPQYVHLRADIPPAGDEDFEGDCESELDGILTTRLLDACSGLKGAFRSLRGEKSSEQPALTSSVNLEGQANNGVEELRCLCGDAGWSFIERSAGRLMIELDVKSGFYQAVVQHRAEGAHVSVEIARSEALAETSRQALSMLLLGTGALVRLACPSIEETENQIVARFEVRFTTMPTAVELAHAFASLSVACAMSGREARAIQDEVIARHYLALGAQASLPASSGNSRKTKDKEQAGIPALQRTD